MQRLNDATEVVHRKPFLGDEGHGKILGSRPAHREVVNRSVNRQCPDVATGKEDGTDDIRIGAEGDARIVEFKDRAVVQRREEFILKAREDDGLQQPLA